MKKTETIDELKTKFEETQRMVSDLEENLQQLQNVFPMDINFRITQLRTAISKAHTKKASFLDEFEPKVQLPNFTDQKYFQELSEKTTQEIRDHFSEINEYQDMQFNKFVREHPGPYYKTTEETPTFPTEKLERIRSMLQKDKDEIIHKLNNLSQRVSLINSSNSGEEEIQIKPMAVNSIEIKTTPLAVNHLTSLAVKKEEMIVHSEITNVKIP